MKQVEEEFSNYFSNRAEVQKPFKGSSFDTALHEAIFFCFSRKEKKKQNRT